MTVKEAINNIKGLLDGCCGPELDDTREAFGMAIKALKKQIPKKAIGNHYAHMKCPSCCHRIPSGQGSSSRRRDNWCNYCGQAILWSEGD